MQLNSKSLGSDGFEFDPGAEDSFSGDDIDGIIETKIAVDTSSRTWGEQIEELVEGLKPALAFGQVNTG